MDLLRSYVTRVIQEGFKDVIDVIVRIRVRIRGPGSRTLRDILTDIRGLINVITVEQIGRITPVDTDGRSFVTLNIKFEDEAGYEVKQMLEDVSKIHDIDMIRFIEIHDPRAGE